ncbi:hypothetical protein GQ53DRAFT_622317, partial [Thozetella sp. PMI_491]
CFTKALPNTTCLLADQDCLCSDATLRASIQACTAVTCTTKEILTTLNATSVACHAQVRDLGSKFKTLTTILTSLSALIMVLRVVQRLQFNATLFPEDWLMILVYFISVAGVLINIYGLTANGLGRDTWTISFDSISRFLLFLYINELVYSTEVFLVKVSLLVFYLRIFTRIVARRVIQATVAFCLLLTLAFNLVATFQCRPIKAFWEEWDQERNGKCLNMNLIVWVNAMASIAVEIWMLVVPLSQLWQLRLQWKKKLGVSLMFGVGIFVTAVSILRLQSLVEFSQSVNPTWDMYSLIYWSIIERNVSIICARLPNLRLLLSRAFPNLL